MHKVSPQSVERVFLVGLVRGDQSVWDVEDSLGELAELASTAGGEVVGSDFQKLEHPVAATFIGKGKASEMAAFCRENRIDVVVFDDDLSPAQGRNLSEIFKVKVIDRTELILDIFAQRARTREGKLQIELAQLQYTLPRLKRMWLHLSRQAGGIGGRGPGETQLEVDRRRIQEKILRITRELTGVRQQRAVQRHGRQRAHVPVLSMVGYTNAGKSTLMNRLTGAGVLAEDKLFATLDPTTRQVELSNRQVFLLTDTVGFIRKLPTHLVESFKATLEEVRQADYLLHVVDVSHRHYQAQIEAVETILKQIGAWGKPVVMIFNKTDRLENSEVLGHLRDRHPASVGLSALTGAGVEDLMQEIEILLRQWRPLIRVKLPIGEAALIAEIRRSGKVVRERYTNKSAF
ncbi:MAG: GTPase HflX, partial [Verrucomicrobiae bacterium]|nr:GTPase HflX [Verrucomicrobiae bacterium]